MRIRSLTMKSFRGFDDATLDLDRPLTVLFGTNGSGKSSVLVACAYSLSEILLHVRPSGDATWIWHADDYDIRRLCHLAIVLLDSKPRCPYFRRGTRLN